MQRRDFLTKSTLLAATLAAPAVSFAASKKNGASLTEVASDCTAKGELCLQHCVESMSTGSKTMAECAASVREMMVYCDALSKAAARKSKHLKELAKITLEACNDCEAQCKKHEKMDVCKACAEACAACAKACETA